MPLPLSAPQIRGSDIACDESALTGESDEVKKSVAEAPFMLSGTAVMRGTGTMLVTCVGLFSEEGIIQKLITGVGAEETERLNAIHKGTRAAVRLASTLLATSAPSSATDL